MFFNMHIDIPLLLALISLLLQGSAAASSSTGHKNTL